MNDWQPQPAQAGCITLDAMFRRAFSLYADRTADSWVEGRLSYAELVLQAGQTAARFPLDDRQCVD